MHVPVLITAGIVPHHPALKAWSRRLLKPRVPQPYDGEGSRTCWLTSSWTRPFLNHILPSPEPGAGRARLMAHVWTRELVENE